MPRVTRNQYSPTRFVFIAEGDKPPKMMGLDVLSSFDLNRHLAVAENEVDFQL
jgi:hypothetical protein